MAQIIDGKAVAAKVRETVRVETEALKEKGISQYQLIKDYGIDKAQLQRLRQNLVVKTLILNRLCQILNCRIEEIMEYVPDDN